MASADAGPLDPEHVLMAVRAVLAHAAKKQAVSGALLQEDETVLLVLALNKIPDAVSLYPLAVPLAHPLHAAPKLCFFASGDGSEAKAALSKAGVGEGIKVMGVTKLRKKYKPFEIRRKLAGSHDVFLCDAAVQDSLRSVLGKSFIHKKKFPLAVSMAGDVGAQIAAARSSAMLHQSAGTTWVIKIGSTAWDARQLAENAVTAANAAIAKHVAGRWSNVRALHVKSESSLSLPIYDAVPPAGLTVEGASVPAVSKRRVAAGSVDEEEENRELLELAREAELDVDEGFRFDADGDDDEENDIEVRAPALPVAAPRSKSNKREAAALPESAAKQKKKAKAKKPSSKK